MTYPRFDLGKAVTDEDGVIHGDYGAIGMSPISYMSKALTSADGKPYLKLIGDPMRNPFEMGVAFPKQKNGMNYYSVHLDSPLFPQPMKAALFPDKDVPHGYRLIWQRTETVPAVKAMAEIDVTESQAMPQQKSTLFKKNAAMTPL